LTIERGAGVRPLSPSSGVTEPSGRRRDRVVLHLAHNHPDLHAGGTEIFARALSRAQSAHPGWRAHFLGAALPVHRAPHPGSCVVGSPGEDGDFLVAGGHFDAKSLTQYDFGFIRDLATLVSDIEPDVVHVHHVLLIGLDSLFAIRRVLPRARIVMTLHDYYPICVNDGLMRRTDGTLCHRATAARCHQCKPDWGLVNHRLRELAVRRAFALVDHVVAPSEHLARTYIEWGLEPARISVIRNGHPDADVDNTATPRPATPQRPVAIGFFGHLTEAKGLPVLLRGAQSLVEAGTTAFRIHVHGSDRFVSDALKQEVLDLQDSLGSVCVRRGPYQRSDVHRLMRSVDWVAVPSVWWENDPLVIQEAFLSRRPVLCSDVGGMAERVPHEQHGLQVSVGDPEAWAETIARVVEDRALGPKLAATLPRPPSMAACAQAYIEAYGAP